MTTETKQQPAPRWYKIAVALIVIAFAILNGVTLGNKSLWIDEMRTGYAMFHGHSPPDLFHYILLNDPAAPLYILFVNYFYIIFFKIFSSDVSLLEISLRLPSLIFGILSIIAFSSLALRLLQKHTTSIAAVVMFAFSTNMVYYSQEAHSYAMFLFFAITAYNLALHVADENRYFMLFAIVCTAGVFVHTLFVIVPINCAIYLFLHRKHGHPHWKNVVDGALIAVVLYIPWFLLMLKFSADPSRTPHISAGILKSAAALFAGLLVGNAYTPLPLAALTAFAALFLWFNGIFKAGALAPRTRSAILILTFVPVVIVTIGMAAFRHIYDFFHFRYLIHIMPLLVLPMAAGMAASFQNFISALKNQNVKEYFHLPNIARFLFICIVLVFLHGTANNLFFYYRTQHQDWRGAYRHMIKNTSGFRFRNDSRVLQGIAASCINFYNSPPLPSYEFIPSDISFNSTNRVSETARFFETNPNSWVFYYRDRWQSQWFESSRRQIDTFLTQKKTFPGLYGDVTVGYSDSFTLINNIDSKLIAFHFMFDKYPTYRCRNIKSGLFRVVISAANFEYLLIKQGGKTIHYENSGVYHIFLDRGPFIITGNHLVSFQIIRDPPIHFTDEGTGPEYGNYFLDWIRE